MKRVTLLVCLGLGAVIALGGTALAEIFLVRGTVGCGAGAVGGSNQELLSTTGQCAVGVVQGSGYVHRIGFWTEAGDIPSSVDRHITGAIPFLPGLSLTGANPFHHSTSLEYAVPTRSMVRITLYDLAGREVRVLKDGLVEPGYHRVRLAAQDLASGVYLCRMTAPGFATTTRVVVVK